MHRSRVHQSSLILAVAPEARWPWWVPSCTWSHAHQLLLLHLHFWRGWEGFPQKTPGNTWVQKAVCGESISSLKRMHQWSWCFGNAGRLTVSSYLLTEGQERAMVSAVPPSVLGPTHFLESAPGMVLLGVPPGLLGVEVGGSVPSFVTSLYSCSLNLSFCMYSLDSCRPSSFLDRKLHNQCHTQLGSQS